MLGYKCLFRFMLHGVAIAKLLNQLTRSSPSTCVALNLVIAKMDGTTNEHPRAKVSSCKFSSVPKISTDSFSNSILTMIENRACLRSFLFLLAFFLYRNRIIVEETFP